MKIIDMVLNGNDFSVSVDNDELYEVTTERELFKIVKHAALAVASGEESLGRKCLVDISSTESGLPLAELYREGKIFRKIFATEGL